VADFATYEDLKRFSASVDRIRTLEQAKSAAAKNLFLSHSSADNAYLPGVVSLLENHGASVYIDRQDGRLPEFPSRETAEILRSAVRACPRFVLFVTTNSRSSVWIPWELGLADGERSTGNVALLPAATLSSEQQWANTEYLGLYRRIVWGKLRDAADSKWFVLDHEKNMGKPLADWIRGGW
jgi:hypothetical protein